MFSKAILVIIIITAVALLLLGLRHQRLAMMNEMTRLHRSIDQQRREVWRYQGQIARRTTPAVLVQKLSDAQLDVAPATPAILIPEPPKTAVAVRVPSPAGRAVSSTAVTSRRPATPTRQAQRPTSANRSASRSHR